MENRSHPASTLALGRTGIVTSSLALGCSRLGSVLTPMGPRECVALVQEALALGIRHFDTASVYGQGDSERFIGRALRGRRAEACIATKAGLRLTAAQALAARCKTPLRLLAKYRTSVRTQVARRRRAGLPQCFEPGFLQRSLEQSLGRLGTDYVDIFYLHGPPLDALRRDDVQRCLQRIQASGKARALGVSCETDEEIEAGLRLDGVAIVQAGLDADERRSDAARLAAELGKVLVLRAGTPPPGAASGAEPAGWLQDRLRGFLGLPAVGGVIVGTTQSRHLEQNVAAWRAALAQGSP